MKEILLTDTLLWNDNVFKAVYIPFDAYYIYYLQEKTEKYDGIYRELVRIEDNSLTYPPRNILDYYKNEKQYSKEDKTQLDYIFKDGAEINIRAKMNDYQTNKGEKPIFEQGSTRELIKQIFTELNDEYEFQYSIQDIEPGLMNPLDKSRLTSEKYKHLTLEEIQITGKIEAYYNTQQDTIFKELEDSITDKFTSRKKNCIDLGRRDLSKYLTKKYGVILRKYIGTLYKRDGNGYAQTSHDDLILQLKSDFESNFIHDTDLKSAIGFISDRLEPIPNIVKFKNTLFDMEKLEPIEEPKKPIFTLLEIPYNYNPNAESTLMKEYLETSLARPTAEETEEAVKGIKEFTGYLFTSGNKHEILPIVTGLTGAGKSVFFNIITAIFGKDKISGISLQRLEKDSHASSQFVNAHLNIIRDSDTSMITNNSLIKNWTGNEAFPINPKYKEPFDLPGEEVPKPILVCNTMPEFKVYEDAIVRRFLIIEFLVSFTKNGKANPNLEKEILSNDEEIEWLIYESIQAYKTMEETNQDFVFKIDEEETKQLIEKHTHPLNHIVSELILKHDPQAYDIERSMNDNFMPVYTDDLVEAILYVSNRDGIDVPVDKHGRINKTTLINVIREEFDLYDGEVVKDKGTGNYSNHREYKARLRRWKGRNEKEYPNLIPTKEYQKVLDSIQAEKILNKHMEAN